MNILNVDDLSTYIVKRVELELRYDIRKEVLGKTKYKLNLDEEKWNKIEDIIAEAINSTRDKIALLCQNDEEQNRDLHLNKRSKK